MMTDERFDLYRLGNRTSVVSAWGEMWEWSPRPASEDDLCDGSACGTREAAERAAAEWVAEGGE